MNNDHESQLVVRFRPSYSAKMYYVKCDYFNQAQTLRDWFRECGAESSVGFFNHVFEETLSA